MQGLHWPGVEREDRTERGGTACLREAARELRIDLRGAKMAIQGYSNVGSYMHKLAQHDLGMQVVAVSDDVVVLAVRS